MELTYKVMMAASQDVGDKNMCANGRTAWNEEDYNRACATFTRLLELAQS